MPQLSASFNKRPRKLWWLVGLLVFALFALLQMPAAWVLNKYAPESPYVQHISGNLWQGSAVWQLPMTVTDKPPLTGVASWTWQPWQLFFGKLGADVNIHTGQTKLDGQLKVGRSSWQINDMSGKLAPETLAAMVDWQLPNTPIQVNAVSLQRQSGANSTANTKKSGFTKAAGQLTWVGGEVGYPSGDKIFYITMPAMRAQLSSEQKNNNNVLHVNLLNNQDKRLGDFYLDGDNMLDVNLTQRLLENMAEYKGQAPQDTPVVSVRQPLLAGLGAR